VPAIDQNYATQRRLLHSDTVTTGGHGLGWKSEFGFACFYIEEDQANSVFRKLEIQFDRY